MAKSMDATEEVLSKLRHEPVEALRAIRNILTGRELKKIEFIHKGLIPSLERCLSSGRTGTESTTRGIWPDTAAIIAIIANTGTPFIHPILQSSVPSILIALLHDSTTDPVALYPILQCLNSIVDHLPLTQDENWSVDNTLSQLLYTKDSAASLVRMLGQSSERKRFGGHQITRSLLDLISRTCITDRHKSVLVEAGIMSAITTYLKRYWTSKSTRNITAQKYSTHRDQLHPIFSMAIHLICQLTTNSARNMKKFLDEDFLGIHKDHGVVNNADMHHDVLSSGRRSHFPSLIYATHSSTAIKRRKASTLHDPGNLVLEDSDEDFLADWRDVTWLLHIVRSRQHQCRVMAARLIAILKDHGHIHPVKVRQFASLLIPILVEMIGQSIDVDLLDHENQAVLQIPSTLALLVKDSEPLQDAAVFAGAIPKLTNALKLNLEIRHDCEMKVWSPLHADNNTSSNDATRRLGSNGPSARIRLNMQHREGILQALAAIAPTKDSHRKEICDYGAVTQIMLALEPSKWSTTTGVYGENLMSAGNSADAVIAACSAIRALTRSATALRTKLVDVDVAKSIIHLLKSSDPEVRIAATMVMANLAHDFSPMKSSIAEQYVIRKLCEQAHSANARLRLESLYALKALVNNSNNTLKQQVVDELGPSWIKHLIATDPRDVPPGEVIGLIPVEYQKGSRIRNTNDVEMQEAEDDFESENDFSRRTLQQDIDIQAELLAFLRNLTTGENVVVIIDDLMKHIGLEDFLQIIVERLQTAESSIRTQSSSTYKSSPEIITNSLYVLAHMCAAKPAYRSAICYHTVMMKQMTSLLKVRSAMVRCAVCWLVNNIVYPTNTREVGDAIPRAKELQKLGIPTEVKRLESSDSSPDVVERARNVSEVLHQLLNN